MAAQLGGAIAQLVEQWTENPCVPGSNPGSTTSGKPGYLWYRAFLCPFASPALCLSNQNKRYTIRIFARTFPMHLIIDLGNTQAKVAFFEGDGLLEHHILKGTPDQIPSELLEGKNIQGAILSSVVHHSAALEKQLNQFPYFIQLQADTSLPIALAYTSPETLGLDRLANAVAACHFYPGQNVLVVDAGTCLKFDLMDASGTYQGGAISPGLNMRYQGLHTLTDKLPLLEGIRYVPLIGTNTEGSIRSGVENGMSMEILGTITAYEQNFNELVVLLTGGDADGLKPLVMSRKKPIFADDFLTLKGLNAILLHHEQNM